MFDELVRLKESPALLQLLTHYADLGAADRHVWQDRLMTLEEVESKELTKLHGELIAYSWVDQNTGVVPSLKPGVVAGCYRITTVGQRALRHARGEWSPEDENESEVPAEKSRPARGADRGEKKPRGKRGVKTAAATGEPANPEAGETSVTAHTAPEAIAPEDNRSPKEVAA